MTEEQFKKAEQIRWSIIYYEGVKANMHTMLRIELQMPVGMFMNRDEIDDFEKAMNDEVNSKQTQFISWLQPIVDERIEFYKKELAAL